MYQQSHHMIGGESRCSNSLASRITVASITLLAIFVGLPVIYILRTGGL